MLFFVSISLVTFTRYFERFAAQFLLNTNSLPAGGEAFVVEQDEDEVEHAEESGGNAHDNVCCGNEHVPGLGYGGLQGIYYIFLLQDCLQVGATGIVINEMLRPKR